MQMPVANAKGGITQYALNILRFLDRDRFRVDFATRSPILDFAGEITAAGGRVHHLSCSSLESEETFAREMHAVMAGDMMRSISTLPTGRGFWRRKLPCGTDAPR